MDIIMIAIVARNGAIGRAGDQPFHISADFRRFKQLTLGNPVVMGRRTFDALPSGALPGRRNIVVTRNNAFSAPDVVRASSLDEAIAMCSPSEKIFLIGGGEIYRSGMPVATRLEITEVDADVPDADVWFPEISPHVWTAADIGHWQIDPRNGKRFRFVSYTRATLSDN